jgi:hypothetical protein
MRAQVVEKNGAGGGGRIPKTDRHIQLSYASFQRFTTLTPPTAQWPTLAENPFVGPDPTTGKGSAPPIVATFAGKQTRGAWLLDTGAAASMISKAQAARLGVTYVAGTEGTNAPKLDGVPEKEQFVLTIGGVGGARKSAGFFLDSLAVPTRERDPLVYRKAPVFVADITVEDPQTKQRVTLDGVLGMNYFVATAYVSEAGMLPDIGQMNAGPYEAIVFDEPAATLGVKLKKELTGATGGGAGASGRSGTIEIKPSKPSSPKRR